jgi:hypothetical protein
VVTPMFRDKALQRFGRKHLHGISSQPDARKRTVMDPSSLSVTTWSGWKMNSLATAAAFGRNRQTTTSSSASA